MQPVAVSRVASTRLHRDYKFTAKVASLQYVSDSAPGIVRIKKGGGFSYKLSTGQTVKDKEVLSRIKRLVIPPAWTNVWISDKDNGHIQATGFDLRQRKQYKYHTQWSEVRNQTKFHRLIEFGKSLPALRKKVEADLASAALPKDKVLATIVSLMEKTFIRVGNNEYEKLYGSYGLTTLKDGHVKINGGTIDFSFKGKKGIHHAITLKNKRLAKIVKACRDIPGKELFQYVNEDGIRCSVDSGMVNNYIKESTGNEFTAKDFRTWAGSLTILSCFKNLGSCEDESDIKKNVVAAIDEVSLKLGNTRTVCRKYYVHPGIVKLYEEKSLNRYLKDLEASGDAEETIELTSEEKVLMRILKKL
jgi:DNA topoisomerase-1